MFYARLFMDPEAERPVPPPGCEIKRIGLEFLTPEGRVSRPGESINAFLDRIAAQIEVSAYLYAQNELGNWMWATKMFDETWEEWEECDPPEDN